MNIIKTTNYDKNGLMESIIWSFENLKDIVINPMNNQPITNVIKKTRLKKLKSKARHFDRIDKGNPLKYKKEVARLISSKGNSSFGYMYVYTKNIIDNGVFKIMNAYSLAKKQKCSFGFPFRCQEKNISFSNIKRNNDDFTGVFSCPSCMKWIDIEYKYDSLVSDSKHERKIIRDIELDNATKLTSEILKKNL